jgi:hypothetical protein
LNGSVLSRPAAFSTASAPVPFWSPTLSVTEDRFTDELDELDEAAALDDDAADVLELLDEEQAAAASPLRAMTEAARNVRLDFIGYP